MSRPPRNRVELRIDELVLDGLWAPDRQRFSEAVEQELTRLLAGCGAPRPLAGGGVPALDGGAFLLPAGASPEAAGVQVARALYQALGRIPPAPGSR
jgi:hypothetical protein